MALEMASASTKKVADVLEDLLRWNVYVGPGFAAAYNIGQRLAGLPAGRRQQAYALSQIIYDKMETTVRAYVQSTQKYVYPMAAGAANTLYFRDVYRKMCTILHYYLETTHNEEAVLAAIQVLKVSYRTNSFPEAAATFYTIIRNQGQPDDKYGCGSDADVKYRITDKACEVLEVSYGKPGTMESPCSKNTYKLPAMPFPQSRDRDDRTGGGGGGGGNRVTPGAAANTRVAVAMQRGGRKKPHSRSRGRQQSGSRLKRRRSGSRLKRRRSGSRLKRRSGSRLKRRTGTTSDVIVLREW